MKALRQIRTQLGLGQAELASLLGTNRNGIMNTELGRQVLPDGALERLASLEMAMAADPVSNCPEIPGKLDWLEQCREREAACRYSLLRLERERRLQGEQFNCQCRLYQVLQNLEQTASASIPGIGGLLETTMERIRLGWINREKLLKQISLLTAEAEWIHQYLENTD